MTDYYHLLDPYRISWESIPNGAKLTKFICTDKGTEEGDRTVTLHGFYDEQGKMYITNEIIVKVKND